MNHAVEVIRLFKLLDRNQRNTFVACFLGWALDAFDFFLHDALPICKRDGA